MTRWSTWPRISAIMRPSIFRTLPLSATLAIPQGLPHHPFSAETRHNLFLAFEESLNNALKHGGATRVRIGMKIEGAWFEIRVHDNGCGFDSEALFDAERNGDTSTRVHHGNGLHNMRQRLAEIGGECRIASRPGSGTTVTLGVKLAPVPQLLSIMTHHE